MLQIVDMMHAGLSKTCQRHVKVRSAAGEFSSTAMAVVDRAGEAQTLSLVLDHESTTNWLLAVVGGWLWSILSFATITRVWLVVHQPACT